MKKYIPLVLAFLIITLTACNKDDSPTAPEITTAETTTTTTLTEPPTTTPPTTTTTTAVTTTEPPETTSAATTTTTLAPTTQAPPPPTTTTTATTEPPVAFDPQIYVDYAIEYGQSIGLRYGREYVGDGGDNPMRWAAWDTPDVLAARFSDESMKRSIREWFDILIRENNNSFFVEYYNASEIEWAAPYYDESVYLLFIYCGT
jgi:hypothetical protein